MNFALANEVKVNPVSLSYDFEGYIYFGGLPSNDTKVKYVYFIFPEVIKRFSVEVMNDDSLTFRVYVPKNSFKVVCSRNTVHSTDDIKMVDKDGAVLFERFNPRLRVDCY